MSDQKKTCWHCAYKMNNIGSADIQCRFNWNGTGAKKPEGDEWGIKNGWYNFPWNYDPVWMKNECQKFKAKTNE